MLTAFDESAQKGAMMAVDYTTKAHVEVLPGIVIMQVALFCNISSVVRAYVVHICVRVWYR